MMRFLQRQRKSIRSGEFFKCHLCLLLIAAMLVAAALPNGVRESGPLDSVKRMGQTGGQEFCPDRKQTGTMVAAPNEERPEVEAAGRELSEAHVIETLRQKSAYRYRNVQQLRLLVWLLECGLAGLLGALFLLAGRERGQQWELIPSGRRIVAYIRRADGKKNGLVSSIKEQLLFYERIKTMNILIWILMIVGGAAGMLSTAYLVLAMPVIFGWKVYRKLKYHIGLYD